MVAPALDEDFALAQAVSAAVPRPPHGGAGAVRLGQDACPLAGAVGRAQALDPLVESREMAITLHSLA